MHLFQACQLCRIQSPSLLKTLSFFFSRNLYSTSWHCISQQQADNFLFIWKLMCLGPPSIMSSVFINKVLLSNYSLKSKSTAKLSFGCLWGLPNNKQGIPYLVTNFSFNNQDIVMLISTIICILDVFNNLKTKQN